MKTLITTFALLMSVMAFGQMRITQSPKAVKESSTNKMIVFVDANMGKKVGGGNCMDLVVAAHNNIHWLSKKWRSRFIHRKFSPRVGDIIEFSGVIYIDKQGTEHRALSHVGIVYEVSGKGEITYADNGFSHVVTLNDMNYKKIKKGKIKFYRM